MALRELFLREEFVVFCWVFEKFWRFGVVILWCGCGVLRGGCGDSAVVFCGDEKCDTDSGFIFWAFPFWE
ncbi:hypothetical protein RBB77_22055 [Tunturibacter psychrotolerans]|uniref:Transmembrane protein n=1 Tax=Tunturiibacter psychrotolerans TaxID=3069686 RepID=A0AAU7ZQ77_9BACT